MQPVLRVLPQMRRPTRVPLHKQRVRVKTTNPCLTVEIDTCTRETHKSSYTPRLRQINQMGQVLNKCFGWQDARERRQTAAIERENKNTESAMHKELVNIDDSLAVAKRLEALREDNLKTASQDIQKSDKKINMLLDVMRRTSQTTPSTLQQTEMMKFVTDKRLAEKELKRQMDARIQAQMLVHSLRELKESTEVRGLEQMLMRRVARTVNDQKDDEVEEHVDQGGDMTARIKERVDVYEAGLKQTVEMSQDDRDSISKEVADYFGSFTQKDMQAMPMPVTTPKETALAKSQSRIGRILASPSPSASTARRPTSSLSGSPLADELA